jgi:protein gp37
MPDRTAISWTDATWNPQVGCSRVSRGCRRCYAETLAAGRLAHLEAYAPTTTDGRFNGTIVQLPERLDQPLRWTRPRLIFANSMSDLFHENLPAEWIAQVVAVMALAQRHRFQVLTKRPERMRDLLADPAFRVLVADTRRSWALPHQHRRSLWFDPDVWPLANVWWGVSIENDTTVGRADVLRETSSAVRWISAEPLVGPLPSLSLEGIDWVVVGGESGNGAAPMHRGWARDLRDRCTVDGIPFHYKQAGEWLSYTDSEAGSAAALRTRPRTVLDINGRTLPPDSECDPSLEPTLFLRVGKRAAGRMLDRVLHDDYPKGQLP